MMRVFLALFASLTLVAACETTQVSRDRPSTDVAFRSSAAGSGSLTQIRADAGLAQLTRDPRLARAARRHAADMARTGNFGHAGSEGDRVGDRVRAAGYRYCTVAENISWGRDSRAEAMRRWMASPPHRHNMLLRRVTEYGYGEVGSYRVLVLGRPC